jgi:hypoxanthine phosphoribosyltransferase
MKNPLEDHLEEIVFSPEKIALRVAELGERISRDYEGRDLVMVAILKGGVIFHADLTRAITVPHVIDFMGASSYGAGTTSSGSVQITRDLGTDVHDRDVLLCEDIYDTGRTLRTIYNLIKLHEPRSLKVCALLVKDRPREDKPVPIDYAGFEIPDRFVVGYGLDYKELYRNLPMIGVLKREVYAS